MKKNIIFLTIILNFYVFGQFALFNLLGIKLQLLFTACLMATILFLTSKWKLSRKYNFVLAILFGSISLGYLFWSSSRFGSIEQVFAFFLAIIILQMNRNEFNLSIKGFIIFTALINFLSLIAFIIVIFDPSISIIAQIPFDSETSNKSISARSFLNYFSLVLPVSSRTSTYEFLGFTLPRLNGFTAEPSATVVPYLVPFSFLLFYRNKFLIILSFFILVAGFVLYGSGISQIIVFLSLAIFVFNFLIKKVKIKGFKKLRKNILYAVLPLTLFSLVNINLLLNIFIVFSNFVESIFSLQLLSSKVGSASFDLRSSGIVDGLTLALTQPLGYPEIFRGVGIGVLYHVSQLGGWFGLAMLIIILLKIFNLIFYFLNQNISLLDTYIVSFIISCFFVSLFISGYGWTRISGVIIYAFVYKGLCLLKNERGRVNGDSYIVQQVEVATLNK
jgi:hypothetical protein